MSLAPIALIALGFAPTVVAPPTPHADPAVSAGTSCVAPAAVVLGQATRLIELWAKGTARTRSKVEPELLHATINRLLDEENGSSRRRADLALLRLGGVTGALDAGPHDLILRRAVLDGFVARAAGRGGDGFTDFVLDEVLLMSTSVDAETRRGACLALAVERVPRALVPLLSVARGADPELRATALQALNGWPDERVGQSFVRAVIDAPDPLRSRFMGLAQNHLFALQGSGIFDLAWPPALGQQLGDAILGQTMSRDWRPAARAVTLSIFVPPERAVPVLVEALGVWTRREGDADEASAIPGARRLRYECADALEVLTGRPIGPHPDRWRNLLASVREGMPLVSAEASRADNTVASFFGLRLRSGSVAFVVDSSGSMEATLPGSRHARGTRASQFTRFDAAAAELLEVLGAAPPPLQFGVVLFADRGVSWKTSPALADDGNLSRLRTWLSGRKPKGGTQLATGLAELIESTDEIEEFPFDTVVVLCDGETREGAGWASDWLTRFNADAQLIFHCVQIGGARAEALRALAEGTGGTFLRVDS